MPTIKSSGTKIIIKPRLARASAPATGRTTAPNTRTSTPSRQSRRTAASSSSAAAVAHKETEGVDEHSGPETESRPETNDHENENENDEDGGESSDVRMADGEEGEEEVDRASEGASVELDDAEEGGEEVDGSSPSAAAPTATSRGRGKSRTKGREGAMPSASGATSTGTSAMKGRGRPRAPTKARGAGTGRTKGAKAGTGGSGPLTIRLPGRTEEEAEKEASDAGVESTDVGAVEEGVEEKEKEKDKEKEKEKEKEAPMGGGKPFRKIQGNVYIIENDEFITPDDPKGDTKIDMYGNLLGGRRFKASTFALPNRHPQRQYMLAIDAARTSGFRDSLYYFRRNLLAFKLNATQPEKDYLIEAGKLGSHLRTRSVTLVTARSAYKLHGAKMIIDGKWVEDDYYEEKSLEEITAKGLKAGDPVGELPDPQLYASESAALAALAKGGGALGQGKGDRAGGGGGGGPGIYRAGGPTTIFGGPGWGPYSDGPLNAVRKSMLNRDGLNEENWMYVAAQRTGEAGEEWARIRKEALKVCGGVLGEERAASVDAGADGLGADGVDGERKRKRGEERDDLPLGVYEAHGGIVHYRIDTQPTRSRWEACPDSDERRVLGGTKTGNGSWALAWVDTVMEF